eukprot:373667_1
MFQATMCMFNDILSGLNKKKSSDSNSKPSTLNKNKHLSASAVIKSYEARHHLYGKFRAAKDISNRSESDKAEISGRVDDDNNGFTEDDQTAYALHLKSLAALRSGKMGLGFGSKSESDIHHKP